MNKYIKYALGALVLVSASGCDDFLDVVPDNRTEINTVEKVGKLIADSYPLSCYAGFLNSRVDYVTDKGTGYNENSSNTEQFFWRDLTETSQDTPTHYWRACYYGIAEVNHALEAIEKMGYSPELDVYIGEGKMVRAYSHFMLASLFSKFYEKDGDNSSMGIPYVTEPEKVALKAYDRRTVKETYESIEEDLLAGLELLGSDNIYQAPRFHFTKAAAEAFATRFYLFKGQWDEVIKHANVIIPEAGSFVRNTSEEIINVAADDAATTYAKKNFQPWLTTFASAAGSTQIKMGFSASDNPANLLLIAAPSRVATRVNSWRYATVYDDVYSTLGGQNVTGGSWAYRIYSSSSFHYYVPKFEDKFVTAEVNASTGVYHAQFPLFRAEEILLNRAEAYAMDNQYDKAIADLNIFCRQRIKSYDEVSHGITEAKLLDYYQSACNNEEHFLNKYDAYGSASWDNLKKSIIMCILEFRRNEFMWEGLRYFDMVRYKIPVTHKTANGDSNTLYPGDDRWVFQIPETSVLAGMELNPRTNLLSKEW